MEWVLGIGALLGLIGSIVGSVYTNNTNVRLTRETNELQQQLAGQANNWQEQMWQRQNAYNDPRSQVSRLAGANLNTAMMMSQGGITNEAGSAGSAHLPAMNVPQVQNPIDPASAADIALKFAQKESIEHQTRREDEKQPLTLDEIKSSINQMNALTENVRELLDGIKSDNARKQVEADIAKRTEDFVVSKFKSDAEISQETARYTALGILTDIGVKEAEENYYRGLAELNDEERKSVIQLREFAKFYKNIDKADFLMNFSRYKADAPFFGKNARSNADLVFENARARKLLNDLVDRYGDIDKVISIIERLVSSAESAASGYNEVQSGNEHKARGNNMPRRVR